MYLSFNCIKFIDEKNENYCWCLFLFSCQVKCILDHFSSVTDIHLDKLRSCELQESSLSLSSTCSSHKSFTSSWGTVHEKTLWLLVVWYQQPILVNLSLWVIGRTMASVSSSIYLSKPPSQYHQCLCNLQLVSRPCLCVVDLHCHNSWIQSYSAGNFSLISH